MSFRDNFCVLVAQSCVAPQFLRLGKVSFYLFSKHFKTLSASSLAVFTASKILLL